MNIAQLLELDREGNMSALKPVSDSVVEAIFSRYPSISQQYLEFLRKVGTGEINRGPYVYEPEPASLVEKHPSFQLYNGQSYRQLTKLFSSREPERSPIPADALIVADSGASWRYCLCPSLGESVFCLDMAGPTFEIDSEDFFTFVARSLTYDVEIQDGE